MHKYKSSLKMFCLKCLSLLFLVYTVPAFSKDLIDREALVKRNSPSNSAIDPSSPFTVGNGKFAITTDVSGFQSFPDLYFSKGVPLETKSRWAWHERKNPKNYTLKDASKGYEAYGKKVDFPSNMDSEAGQWLRQNPHDLPFARFALQYKKRELEPQALSAIQQNLDLLSGLLTSRYQLAGSEVEVNSAVHAERDAVAFKLRTPLIERKAVSVLIQFPRGYDLNVKNTPDLVFANDDQHKTVLDNVTSDKHGGSALFQRLVDDSEHWLQLSWQGKAKLQKITQHQYRLEFLGSDRNNNSASLVAEYSQQKPTTYLTVDSIVLSAKSYWNAFWKSGAAVDFSGSTDPRASELERRVVLSQYITQVQSGGAFPAQETGLTSSSWYGKHHTEMAIWHSAHWAVWQRQKNLERVLQWFNEHVPVAQATAKQRGLEGARWSKMIGPEGRESPGGNPLIIWNQPGPIYLAELLYQNSGSQARVLKTYSELVEQSAMALSSMLVWEEDKKRYSLTAPIWIAQEIYEPHLTKNPGFELSFWRDGLMKAQQWRVRQGLPENALWKAQIDALAPLPVKDGRYVAIESIPDTFDNIESRGDHPSMLASWGLLADDRVNLQFMASTLDAVLKTWNWEERIWGWDYPMIAMTALKLGQSETAVDILMSDGPNNLYLNNGHVPQSAASLPVYLPANGSLLLAVARFLDTDNYKAPHYGFPANGKWKVLAEGF